MRVSRIPADTSSQQVADRRAERSAILFFNDSDQYVKLRPDGAASLTDFSIRLAPGSPWECSRAFSAFAWYGIWEAAASVNGALVVTEAFGV